MAEAAAATTPAPASTGAPPPSPSAGAPSVSAGATLNSVPTGAAVPPAWLSEFKNDELKSYVQERKFTNPEQIVERYKNLESLRGVPEDRLLKLPEKMEGPEARAIWEKLGAPKDMNGYEFDSKDQDPQFIDWAKDSFFKNNLTKSQGQSLVKAYNDFMSKSLTDQQATRSNSILQADEKLKSEWGAQYETNVNLAKQGAKVLGLDAKTLDVIEAVQGRETLFKTLKSIGVGVGESNFVDGSNQPPKALTAEEAQSELKTLLQDKKFAKKVSKGDVEALERWNTLNRLAAPGDKQL